MVNIPPSSDIYIRKGEGYHMDLSKNPKWHHYNFSLTQDSSTTLHRREVWSALEDMGDFIYKYNLPKDKDLVFNMFTCILVLIKSTYHIHKNNDGKLNYLIRMLNTCEKIFSENNIDILKYTRLTIFEKALYVIEKNPACYAVLSTSLKSYYEYK
jgi:hypothetical protein